MPSPKPVSRTLTAQEYAELGGPSNKARYSILVPISIASTVLEIEQTTVRAHIRQGKLREVVVDCDGSLVKGVALGSLHDVLAEREDAVQELTERLEPIIWHRGCNTIEYGELMPFVDMSTQNPHHRDMIGRALGKMSLKSYRDHGFMISALVVLKSSQRPNEIFFRFAEDIGAKKKSMGDERFWQKELDRIKDWFGPQEGDDEDE